MTTTSTSRPRRNLLRLTAHAAAIGTLAGFAAASTTFASPAPAAAAAVTTMSEPQLNAAPPAASPQGIIMSDGRICNPRWGC